MTKRGASFKPFKFNSRTMRVVLMEHGMSRREADAAVSKMLAKMTSVLHTGQPVVLTGVATLKRAKSGSKYRLAVRPAEAVRRKMRRPHVPIR